MSTPTEMIVKAKAFQPTEITYKPAVVNARGGKNVKIQFRGNPLVISVPLMFTWGVNERVDESSGRISYDTSLVFETEKSSSIKSFCEKMKVLENKVLDDACSKSKEWFGKSKLSREVAEAMMYPILKYPKDKNSGELDLSRNPNMKLKLPYWEGVFNLELYDMKGKPLFLPTKEGAEGPQGSKTPVDLVPSRTYVKGLVACNGIWMAGGRFGLTWKLVQAQVRPPVRLVGMGVCHIDSDSDDEELLDVVKSNENKNDDYSEVEKSSPNFSDGEDVEEVEEEVEEVEEVKPKKIKKKVRRKKKVGVE
jgi:hypothetical protein